MKKLDGWLIGKFILLALLLFMFVFPLYWLVMTTLKPGVEVIEFPPRFVPSRLFLDNYPRAWTEYSTSFLYRNTAIASLVGIALGLLIGIPAAYSAARFRYKGRDDFMFFILTTRFLPPITAAVPLYIVFKSVGMLNNVFALGILYAAMNLPIITWVLRAYFREIPIELEQSYMLDGHSRLKAFFKIIFPLSWPGIAAVTMLSVCFSWGEFLFALLFTFNIHAKTLPVKVAEMQGDIGILWGEITVIGTIALIPLMVFFVIIQRHLVRGLSFGALK